SGYQLLSASCLPAAAAAICASRPAREGLPARVKASGASAAPEGRARNFTGRASGASIGRASKSVEARRGTPPLRLEADDFGREPGDLDFGFVHFLLCAAALRVTLSRHTRHIVHDPMQILGRADRLIGLVVLGEGDLDLLD